MSRESLEDWNNNQKIGARGPSQLAIAAGINNGAKGSGLSDLWLKLFQDASHLNKPENLGKIHLIVIIWIDKKGPA